MSNLWDYGTTVLRDWDTVAYLILDNVLKPFFSGNIEIKEYI
jgi:hypothetical protein